MTRVYGGMMVKRYIVNFKRSPWLCLHIWNIALLGWRDWRFGRGIRYAFHVGIFELVWMGRHEKEIIRLARRDPEGFRRAIDAENALGDLWTKDAEP